MLTKHYAVIGHPIGHTISPFIHTRLFELAGIDSRYEVLEIAPEDLKDKISYLKSLDGFNITIPHKQNIIPYLDALDKKAALYGSVNTVRSAEQTVGYTTDPDGFLKALKNGGIPLNGTVVILGAGGVARTMAYEAAFAGCRLTLAVRAQDLHRAEPLAAQIKRDIPSAQVDICMIDSIGVSSVDLLINATPVGMYPHMDAMPVQEAVLSRCASVFDAVYNPIQTALLSRVAANGAKTLGGLSMLVWQAVVAHEIWDGSTYSADTVNQLCEDAAAELHRQYPESRQTL